VLDTKLKNRYSKDLIIIFLITIIPAVITFGFYPMVHRNAMKMLQNNPQDTHEMTYEECYGDGYIYDIYKSGYVLYEDFVLNKDDNAAAEVNDDYFYIMNHLRSHFYGFSDHTDYLMFNTADGTDEWKDSNPETNMVIHQDAVKSFLFNGTPLQEDLYDAWVCISYDSAGSVKILGYNNLDADALAQQFQMYRMGNPLEDDYGISLSSLNIKAPKNMIVFYGLQDIMDYAEEDNWYLLLSYYKDSGIREVFLIALLIVAAAAVWYRRGSVYALNDSIIFRIPMEITITGLFLTVSWMNPMIKRMLAYMYNQESGFIYVPRGIAGGIYQVISWLLIYLFWFWMIGCLASAWKIGIKEYVKQYSCIYRCFPFVNRKWKQFTEYVLDVDITENMEKSIRKLVVINGIVISVLCVLWFGGIIGVIIYSVFLFIYLRKYLTKIRTQYMALLNWICKLSAGELNARMEEDAGVFTPIREELSHIQIGFKHAVEEEVKSQKMKTELITNVSHDLKTPLTAIITYVDLLKNEDITPEERADYIRILDKKSMRLKVLIEDLFEISKASSNNVTMNFSEVDIVNLLKQVRFELDDKIAESGLDFRWNLPDEKRILKLDSQKTYRIFENLIVNCLKYSMPHSRVYVEWKETEDQVITAIKNMSATELNFDPREITERFVRGDLSRNTEGSGLGLAIARSFTELQNGTLNIEIDGDLFKAIVKFKK